MKDDCSVLLVDAIELASNLLPELIHKDTHVRLILCFFSTDEDAEQNTRSW